MNNTTATICVRARASIRVCLCVCICIYFFQSAECFGLWQSHHYAVCESQKYEIYNSNCVQVKMLTAYVS